MYGIKELNSRNFDTAVETFKQIVEIEPTNADALGWLARSLLEAGNSIEAENAINRNIELAPKDFGSFLIRGWTRQAQKKYQEAIEDYDEFIEHDELVEAWDADVFLSLGRCYEELGEYQKAINAYVEYGTWPYGYHHMPDEDIKRVKEKLKS